MRITISKIRKYLVLTLLEYLITFLLGEENRKSTTAKCQVFETRYLIGRYFKCLYIRLLDIWTPTKPLWI